MPAKKDDQNMQAGSIQSIKAEIQSLAHQLWVEKWNAVEGADWLVDGRLRSELDELSRGELVRVKRLLARSAGKVGGERKYMTSSPV